MRLEFGGTSRTVAARRSVEELRNRSVGQLEKLLACEFQEKRDHALLFQVKMETQVAIEAVGLSIPTGGLWGS